MAIFGRFLASCISASPVQQVSDLHLKFALLLWLVLQFRVSFYVYSLTGYTNRTWEQTFRSLRRVKGHPLIHKRSHEHVLGTGRIRSVK